MRTRLLVLLLAVLLVPAPADAWGWEAHFLIMERAIALLPPELRPLFEKHRAKVVERIIDPDTWRNAGFADEEPNHFLDLDWEGYGKDPFPELPRDYTAAVAKFGRARITDNGAVPWRTEEMFGNLRRAFQDYGAAARSARTTSFTSRRGCRTTCRMPSSRSTASSTTTASSRGRTASTPGSSPRWSSATRASWC